MRQLATAGRDLKAWTVNRAQIVYQAALACCDIGPLQGALSPQAKWPSVEDGRWNCENRAATVEVMRHDITIAAFKNGYNADSCSGASSQTAAPDTPPYPAVATISAAPQRRD